MGQHNEGNLDSRQEDMRDENKEIDWTDGTLPEEAALAVEVMVEDVADKKEDGGSRCGDHKIFVPLCSSIFNFPDSHDEQYGGCEI